jgi:serine protease Do
VLRDGNGVDVPVTLESMTKGDHESGSADSVHGKPRWGIGLGDLTPDVREQLQADDSIHGAVIEQVTPGSPADNAGLQQGDIITEVDRHAMHSAADVQKALSDVPKDGDALVLVWSKAGSTFRVLHSMENN